ncbi:hypothetical protein [Georgenia yuyongxinii]|uniref:Uncharacterized protein n=1 Tax=Georgenia yuyongxinii TaxID=2589797 RepID=A0A552WUD4_9MICO|nr:hypothetical protein [Georgenia yuyongxinii]TRW46402.1 hypothetical protein FJ693_05600 [Georgenia yuyongxinii]
MTTTTAADKTTTATIAVWQVAEHPSLEAAVDHPDGGRTVGWTTDQWHAVGGDWPIAHGFLVARPVRVERGGREHAAAIAAAQEHEAAHAPTVPTLRDLLHGWDTLRDGIRDRRRARRVRRKTRP